MKIKYKHSTAQFGDPAECYVSRLFWLRQIPNGSRMPDLSSVNGRYNPKFLVEVKAGKNKGVMVEYQLHYSVQTANDFKRIFNKEFSGNLPIGESAFYYCLPNRLDRLTANDMARPFSNLKVRFGDIYMAPGDYCFTAFAAARSLRTGEDIADIMPELKASMQRNVIEGQSNSEQTKRKGPQSWQDLHSRDILAFFNRCLEQTTEHGRKRVDLIRSHYSQVDDLLRIQIPGPAGTNIYALVKPEHSDLIDVQLRKTVDERRPIIEEVIRQRKISSELIEDILANPAQKTFWEMPVSVADLHNPATERLNRLSRWLLDGEEELIVED